MSGHANRKHGEAGLTPEYHTWQNLKRRCLDPKNADYHLYGGKGISVCAKWQNSFEAFLEDMGRRPSRFHSIDRIDSSKNYCLENCRWATAKEQGRNTCRTRLLTFNSKTQCIKAWAEELGMGYQTLLCRINRYKWSVEKALTTKVR